MTHVRRGLLSLALALFVSAFCYGICQVTQGSMASATSAATESVLSLQTPAPSAGPVIPLTISTNLTGMYPCQIDVDLNHDGRFHGAGELAYARAALSGRGVVRLHGLAEGSYQVRARIHLPGGQELVSEPQTLKVLPSFNQLPVSYEPNKGQTDSEVLFLGRTKKQMVYITATETVLVTTPPRPADPKQKPEPPQVQRFRLVGANPHTLPVGEKQLPGRCNYFIGNDPSQWRTDIETYQEVVRHGVYPGIDLVYHSGQGQLEYDFRVAPGADPRAITLEFPDVTSLSVDDDGVLVLGMPQGQSLRKTAPVVYQKRGAQMEAVKGDWHLKGPRQAGYVIAAYDPTRELVIDPILFSTFLGGAGGEGLNQMVRDLAGNIYVSGGTSSANYPTTAGAFQTVNAGNQDVYITKINPAGTAMVYSTFLGGAASDGPVFGGLGLAVNAAGEVVVNSETSSANFPLMNPAQAAIVFFFDTFVTHLNAAGNALIFSTYLGGGGFDYGYGAAFDAAGNVYVTGATDSGNFPTTAGVVQTVYGGGGLQGDAFITKYSPTGTMLYSTYLGGTKDEIGSGIAVVGSNVYVGGVTASNDFPTTAGAFQSVSGGKQDMFVAQLNATASALVYSTYLGGTGDDGAIFPSSPFGAQLGFAVDSGGNAYIGSGTNSNDYPVTPGVLQATLTGSPNAVVTKLNPTGTALVYSTYLGGTKGDVAYAMTIDLAGNAYVGGSTTSPDFPIVNQVAIYTPPFDNMFVSVVNPTATALGFSTYLGTGFDDARGVAPDGLGNLWVGGNGGNGFPLVNPLQVFGGGITEGVVAKITNPGIPIGTVPGSPTPTPTPSPSPSGSEGSFVGTQGPPHPGSEGCFGPFGSQGGGFTNVSGHLIAAPRSAPTAVDQPAVPILMGPFLTLGGNTSEGMMLAPPPFANAPPPATQMVVFNVAYQQRPLVGAGQQEGAMLQSSMSWAVGAGLAGMAAFVLTMMGMSLPAPASTSTEL